MLDLNQPGPTEASQQTRPPTRWSCTRCGETFRGVPEPSLDPRWAFARCKACGKRVVVVREPIGTIIGSGSDAGARPEIAK
jgi:DNA-directed RNA polymerase subunit RPC12/RpoP